MIITIALCQYPFPVNFHRSGSRNTIFTLLKTGKKSDTFIKALKQRMENDRQTGIDIL